MAKSFDELVKRTTTKRTQARAAVRTQELLAELLLSEVRQLAGKSQQQVAQALGIKQPSALSQLNFGIDRLEFASGIVNFHLPIDTALGTVDVV